MLRFRCLDKPDSQQSNSQEAEVYNQIPINSLTIGVRPSATGMLLYRLGHPFLNISNPREPNESSVGWWVSVSHVFREAYFIQVRVGLPESSLPHSRAHLHELQFHISPSQTLVGNKCQLLTSWLCPTFFLFRLSSLHPYPSFLFHVFSTNTID